MELKNKIDWQVKNLQECGLTIQASGRNEFHVIGANVTNFAYYWTKKEPKTFENTSKNGKKYFVLAWHFDNVSKWVSIPTFKKIMVEDWYLISLERKFTSNELIKELDQAAQGYDDVEPFVMKDDIYIKSVAKNNRDITKLNDAIAKNNTDLIEEEKEAIVKENKVKRIADKKALDEKFAPNQGSDCSDKIVKIALKDVYQDLIDKKVKLNEVIELLNNAGLTNQDIIKTLNYIGATESFEDFEIYTNANELASEIVKVYNVAFK